LTSTWRRQLIVLSIEPERAPMMRQVATFRGHFESPLLRDLLRGSSFAAATTEIKGFFTSLARPYGFKVTAGRTSEAHGGEWLYDLTWYEESDGFYRRQIMVLESEMHLGTIADCDRVDVDFHKLVQARAEIRVWVAALPSAALLSGHLENCKRQIVNFSQGEADDFYLFVLFDWSSGTTVVEGYRRPPSVHDAAHRHADDQIVAAATLTPPPASPNP
jgi:hypothetical protein